MLYYDLQIISECFKEIKLAFSLMIIVFILAKLEVC